MPRRMVAPDGEVRMVDDTDVPRALAGGAVTFGSPEHVAMMGTAPVGRLPMVRSGDRQILLPAVREGYRPGDVMGTVHEAAQPFIGAAKGAANTGMGIASLLARVPGLNRAPGLRPEQMAADAANIAPEGVGQNIGYTGEQLAEFLGPTALGSEAGAAIKVGENISQARHAAGTILKGKNVGGQLMNVVRTPKVGDLIRRGLVRGATEATATGALNAAQGGDFTTGALTGGAGGVVSALGPAGIKLGGRGLDTALKNRYVQNTLTTALGGGVLGTTYGLATGGITPGDLAKYGLEASVLGLASPKGRALMSRTLPVFSRGAVAAGLQFDRQEPGSSRTVKPKVNMTTSTWPTDAHVNKGD